MAKLGGRRWCAMICAHGLVVLRQSSLGFLAAFCFCLLVCLGL